MAHWVLSSETIAIPFDSHPSITHILFKNEMYYSNIHRRWKVIRVFPEVDHSARSDRIVLVEFTTGSVVELNFC